MYPVLHLCSKRRVRRGLRRAQYVVGPYFVVDQLELASK